MAKKSLEAHVGGVITELEQDPFTGAIIGFKPDVRRYFNREYYFQRGLGNNRWSSSGAITPAPRAVALP
jgi:hypothetical protein